MSKTERSPHVVVVGSGFGGMAAARGLRRAPVRVTIVDRSNHHLFQPLLYQVATAAPQPGRHRGADPPGVPAPVERERDAGRRDGHRRRAKAGRSWPTGD